MFAFFIRSIKIYYWLSLYTVAGGAIFFVFISRYFGYQPSGFTILAFSLAMWLVYLIDHLKDSKKPILTLQRHIFHRDFRKLVKALIFLCLVTLAVLCFFVERHIFVFGFVLAIFCGIYLWVNNWLGFYGIKEIFIAMVFSSAVHAYPLSSAVFTFYPTLISIMLVAMLALVNILIIAYFDIHTDKATGFGSFPMLIGRKKTKIVIMLFGLAIIVASVLIFGAQGLFSYLILASLYLLLVFFIQYKFPKLKFHSAAADGVFYISGLFLIFSN